MALVRSEQRKLTSKKAKNEDRSRHFIESGITMGTRAVSATSEGSDWPPTGLSGNKTNPRAYSNQRYQLGYENDLHNVNPPRAVPGQTGSNSYRKNLPRRTSPNICQTFPECQYSNGGTSSFSLPSITGPTASLRSQHRMMTICRRN